MYGLPFRRNDYHLGRLLHVENVPASNARRNEYKTFKDVTFKEGFALVVIIAVLFFFWDVSKPITDLITPSLENILTHIIELTSQVKQ
jgi:NADH:ubiquinone oxidoreductase subunit 4 (subunit M)